MKSFYRAIRRSVSKALVIVLCALPGVAQQSAGSLRGQLTDQTGAVIVRATVTIDNSKGIKKTVPVNDQGVYLIENLPPGRYTVRAKVAGFGDYNNAAEIIPGQRTQHDIKLDVVLEDQKVKVEAGQTVTSDADNNASAIVIKGPDLDALPDDPDELALLLQSLAGPSAGPNGIQIYVDGFTATGRLPSKASIREIHINRNPFSADNDRLGYGRVDLFTKPGTEKLHGRFDASFNDESLNTRNPFAPNKAPYQARTYGVVISGAMVPKRVSYILAVHRREFDDNAIINATVLDSSLNIVPFSEAVLAPRGELHVSPRVDILLGQNNTLLVQYLYTRTTQENAGIGDFSLASRAFSSGSTQQGFRLIDTAILSPRLLTDTRFQFMRPRRNLSGDNSVPTISVLDAFIGGGSSIDQASNAQNSWEFHNYTTLALGKHTLKIGGRLRGVEITDISGSNFGGTYVFAGGPAVQLDANNQIVRDSQGQPVIAPITSIERFQLTERLRASGLSGEEIRALGGGAAQFSIAGGNREAGVNQMDVGIFAQDDWRLRPNFTLSLGLRYETQNNISRTLDFAPRVAFAWAPGGTSGQLPKMVIRGGAGVFFDRFSEIYTLQASRFNGINQQQYVVDDPAILDLYPRIPSAESLTRFAVPQTIRQVSEQLRSPYTYQSSISVERRLPKNTMITLSYLYSRAVHVLRARNINAPLPGTFLPSDPSSAERPFGDVGNILAYESSGIFKQHQVIVNFTNRLNRNLSVFANYALNWAHSDTDGTGSFPADTYDLTTEFGRSSLDVRHRFFVGGVYNTFWGLSLNTLIVMRSGAPFNIFTGLDRNGDTLFADRPAFARDQGKPGVVITKFGAFDLNPGPGDTIIPRNFGQGPSLASVNVRINKTVGFGGGAANPAPQQAVASGGSQAAPTRQANGPSRAAEQPYKLIFGVQVQNLFNHTNAGTPIGNLSSNFFGLSNSTAGSEIGVGSATSNRRITFQLGFSF